MGGILPLPARGDVADVISGPGGGSNPYKGCPPTQHERGIAKRRKPNASGSPLADRNLTQIPTPPRILTPTPPTPPLFPGAPWWFPWG